MADQQINAIVKGLEKLTERVVSKITLDITANLIETTPIDTGWARANWVPAIGTPYLADLGGPKPSSAGISSQATEQAAATAKVATGYKLSMGKVFVSNNVPYILKLNQGWSSQAPAAFVQRAIHKAVTEDIKGIKG